MDYLELIDRHFGYLVREFGFQITSRFYHPELYGNFVVMFQRKDLQIRLIRDRHQVFVDFSLGGKHWKDKEKILETLGVPMNRTKLTNWDYGKDTRLRIKESIYTSISI